MLQMNPEDENLDPLEKMKKDLREGAANLSPREARFLVDRYYTMQDYRTHSNNQVNAIKKSGEAEPHRIMTWLADQSAMMENEVKKALLVYAKSKRAGRWAMSNYGVAEVITAGLLAHIDINKAPNVAKVFRFAGLDPSNIWLGEKGAKEFVEEHGLANGDKVTVDDVYRAAAILKRNQDSLLRMARKKTGGLSRESLEAALARRPWNDDLKRLCYLIGESFKKFSGKPQCYYASFYLKKRAQEIVRNASGEHVELCKKTLTSKRWNNNDTRAWYKGCFKPEIWNGWYGLEPEQRLERVKNSRGKPGSGVPMIPPGRIDARACRYATKIFLSHFHHVLHESVLGRPPVRPYALDILKHSEYIPVPNWPCP